MVLILELFIKIFKLYFLKTLHWPWAPEKLEILTCLGSLVQVRRHLNNQHHKLYLLLRPSNKQRFTKTSRFTTILFFVHPLNILVFSRKSWWKAANPAVSHVHIGVYPVWNEINSFLAFVLIVEKITRLCTRIAVSHLSAFKTTLSIMVMVWKN